MRAGVAFLDGVYLPRGDAAALIRDRLRTHPPPMAGCRCPTSTLRPFVESLATLATSQGRNVAFRHTVCIDNYHYIMLR